MAVPAARRAGARLHDRAAPGLPHHLRSAGEDQLREDGKDRAADLPGELEPGQRGRAPEATDRLHPLSGDGRQEAIGDRLLHRTAIIAGPWHSSPAPSSGITRWSLRSVPGAWARCSSPTIGAWAGKLRSRSEEHTSELQS